jgi:hypothetical protein
MATVAAGQLAVAVAGMTVVVPTGRHYTTGRFVFDYRDDARQASGVNGPR